MPSHLDLLRPFTVCLMEKGMLTPQSLAEVLDFRRRLDPRIGQLAVLKGYLSPEEILEILTAQTSEKERFGEIALRENLLQLVQVRDLLSLQKDPLGLLVESVLATRGVSEAEMRALVSQFMSGDVEPPDADGDSPKRWNVP
ncbi:MAG: hypothetical protein ACYTAF_09225, partial [Planctomycetota bacterium]